MSIKYKENGTFELKQLIELYKNVGWTVYDAIFLSSEL